jgi:hypothetical protein
MPVRIDYQSEGFVLIKTSGGDVSSPHLRMTSSGRSDVVLSGYCLLCGAWRRLQAPDSVYKVLEP